MIRKIDKNIDWGKTDPQDWRQEFVNELEKVHARLGLDVKVNSSDVPEVEFTKSVGDYQTYIKIDLTAKNATFVISGEMVGEVIRFHDSIKGQADIYKTVRHFIENAKDIVNSLSGLLNQNS